MDILYPILAATLVSLLSLIGLVFYSKKFQNLLIYFVAFSAGALLGGAFFHLLVEALEINNNFLEISIYLILGFSAFFILENFLYWHHCHQSSKECTHHISYLNLIGDFFHNFLDGLAIGISFLVSPSVGLASTLAIASHELPQEMGDMAILLHFGLKKSKAILLNFLISLTSILGAIFGFYFSQSFEPIKSIFLSFCAGNFVYMAASDLIPEIKSEKTKKGPIHAGILFFVFIIGIVFLFLIKILFES
jgi:zinc and cadmium transporter